MSLNLRKLTKKITKDRGVPEVPASTWRYFISAFLKRYINPYSIRPAIAHLSITERCNFRCVTCNEWKLGDKSSELSIGEWKKVIDELAKLDYRMVRFTGGEPLIRDDLMELIHYTSEKNLTTLISTNGSLITEKKAQKLPRLKVSQVTISLNGIGQNQNEICGVEGAFSKIKSNLSYLANNSVPILLAVTIMEQTIDQIPNILDFAKTKSLPVLFNLYDDKPYFFRQPTGSGMWIENQKKLRELIQYLKEEKRNHPSLIQMPLSALSFISKYFEDPIQKDIPCIASLINTYINAKGEVYGGCYVFEPLGNIRDAKLEEILSSSAYQARIRKTFNKECPGCSCGYVENLAFSWSFLAREVFDFLRTSLRGEASYISKQNKVCN